MDQLLKEFNDYKYRGDWDAVSNYIEQLSVDNNFKDLLNAIVLIEQSDYDNATKILNFQREEVFNNNCKLEFAYNVVKMHLSWKTKQIDNMIEPQEINDALLLSFQEEDYQDFNYFTGWFYNLSSKLYSREGNLSLSEEYIKKGMEYYDKADDKFAIIKSMINLSVVEKDRGNYEGVLTILSNALNDLQSLDQNYATYKLLYFMTMGNLASTYLKLNQFHKALDTYNEIEELVKDRGNDAEYCIHLINKGSVFSSLERFDDAKELLVIALEITKKISNQFLMAYVYRNLGSLEYHIRNIPQALNYLHKSLEISEKMNLNIVTASNYSIIGMIQALQGQIDLAHQSYLKVMDLINTESEIFDPDFLDSSYQTFAIISARKGNPEIAHEYWSKQYDICQQKNDITNSAHAKFSLFLHYLDHHQDELIEDTLDDLRHNYKTESAETNRGLILLGNLANAIYLKYSNTKIEEAIDIFETIVNQNDLIQSRGFSINHLIIAIYQLSEIYIHQLQNTGKLHYLTKANNLADLLLDLAISQQIVVLKAESYILKAKLAVLDFEMIEANNLLLQAKSLANEYNLKSLEDDILNEIDLIVTGKSFKKSHNLSQLVVDSKILLFLQTKGGSKGSYPTF